MGRIRLEAPLIHASSVPSLCRALGFTPRSGGPSFKFIIVALVALYVRAVAASHGPHPWDVPISVTVTRVEDARVFTEELVFADLTRPDVRGRAFLIDGGLAFMLELDHKTGAPRALYGRDVFRLALHEFGDRVRFIRATWLPCRTLRDNLDQFNAATARGLAPDRAARETWTGRTAARFGFTVPRSLKLVGVAGRYSEVKYAFERPPPPPPTCRARFTTGLRQIFSK